MVHRLPQIGPQKAQKSQKAQKGFQDFLEMQYFTDLCALCDFCAFVPFVANLSCGFERVRRGDRRALRYSLSRGCRCRQRRVRISPATILRHRE